jgi:hypothetical protein
MTREYSSSVNIHIRRSLDVLADRNTAVEDYRAAMLALGKELGNNIVGKIHSLGLWTRFRLKRDE